MIDTGALTECRRVIAQHSKSFALASRLLPTPARDRALVLYAWCRHVDDSVDKCAGDTASALRVLREELQAIYSGAALSSALHTAFRDVAQERHLPLHYPTELLEGMAMDVSGYRYLSMHDLLRYCFRVAGVVGLMMCHALGVRDVRALSNAVDLGVAMQLTNICRDVAEDWALGRLYLPQSLLEDCGIGTLDSHLGSAMPERFVPGIARVVRTLLSHADDHYRQGDRGLKALNWRSAIAVSSARHIYAAIGPRIARADHNVLAGRQFVTTADKFALIARAVATSARDWPGRIGQPPPVPPREVVQFDDWYRGSLS